MRALVQRVTRAAVRTEEKPPVEIGTGLLILLGVGQHDTTEYARFVAEKCANIRIFSDEQGKMNFSLLDIKGEAMVVSQFTLYGDTRKGRRPGFSKAADPQLAVGLYQEFTKTMRDLGLNVETGVFGAHMEVEIHNDGPVTLLVEYPD